jgi:hypothetical protein
MREGMGDIELPPVEKGTIIYIVNGLYKYGRFKRMINNAIIQYWL